MMIIAYPFNDMYEPSHSPALEPPCVVMISSGVFKFNPSGDVIWLQCPHLHVPSWGVEVRAGLYG